MEKSGHNKLSKLVSGKPRLMETGGFTMRFESGKSERLFCKFLLKKAKTNHRQGYIKLSKIIFFRGTEKQIEKSDKHIPLEILEDY